MQAIGGIDGQSRHVEVFEDTQRNERAYALAVRRDFVQRVTTVVLPDRLDPVALVGGQIGHRHRAAVQLRVGDDFFGKVALIKRFALGFRDAFERARLVRQI